MPTRSHTHCLRLQILRSSCTVPHGWNTIDTLLPTRYNTVTESKPIAVSTEPGFKYRVAINQNYNQILCRGENAYHLA